MARISPQFQVSTTQAARIYQQKKMPVIDSWQRLRGSFSICNLSRL